MDFIIWIAMEMSKLRKKIEIKGHVMNTLSSNTMKVNRTHSVHFYWMLKKAGNVSKKLT